jgi:carotenoid cleavage dioxygenase-like enzyme
VVASYTRINQPGSDMSFTVGGIAEIRKVERAMSGRGFPYEWSDDYGARLGVMPHGGGSADVRWFEIAPCYVFHPLNAFDDGRSIVLDVARYDELWRGGPDADTSARDVRGAGRGRPRHRATRNHGLVANLSEHHRWSPGAAVDGVGRIGPGRG